MKHPINSAAKPANPNNYAFIDGNNLYLGAKSQKVKLDYRKLRLYLKNKFHVSKAFLFIGYDKNNESLYDAFREYGYELIFKPVVFYTENGKRQMKGNVDAELVLHAAAIEYRRYNQAVIISGDGDFACLLEFLQKKNKLARIIAPTKRYSKLLYPFRPYITNLIDIIEHIQSQPSKTTKKDRH
jgi:uncharacterized LabA/DUF88 family protein